MTRSTHAVPTATRTTRDLTKAAVSGWLGTAMEFLDFFAPEVQGRDLVRLEDAA